MTNKTKKRKHLILAGLLIIALIVLLNMSAKAEIQDPVREITNCVHGDSMTPEVCAKFDPPKVEPQKEAKPVKEIKPAPQQVYIPFEGK